MELRNEQFLYLTTIGRKSGKSHEIEIWFVIREGRFYVLAEYPNSNWVKNIRQSPRIKVRVGTLRFEGSGRVLDEQQDSALWRDAQELSREKYKWGDGVPVELTPASPLSDKELR